MYQSSKSKKSSADAIYMEKFNTLKQRWEKEIEELKVLNEATQNGARNQIFVVVEKVLDHRIKFDIEKIEDVHRCYTNLLQALE